MPWTISGAHFQIKRYMASFLGSFCYLDHETEICVAWKNILPFNNSNGIAMFCGGFCLSFCVDRRLKTVISQVT